MVSRCRTSVLVSLHLLAVSGLGAEELQFESEQLGSRLTVGYAVRLIDMNDDGKKDIVIVDSKRFLWLKNPSWEEHVILEATQARYDNVCFAPYDIDGDGRLDFAVGRDWQFTNTTSGGTIGWLQQGAKPTGLWRYHSIGAEPTTHRMRFVDLDGDGRKELVVAPLKGRGTTPPNFAENGVRLLAYKIPKNPVGDPWKAEVVNDQLTVMHNFWYDDVNQDGDVDLLTASFEGVSLLELEKNGTWKLSAIGTGNQMTKPNRGASEIRLGRLAGGTPYIATIEPWHGFQVAVYNYPQQGDAPAYRMPWTRRMLDDQLKWGHAVCCANLDDDDDDELIIGVRDHKDNTWRSGLRIYDPQDDGGTRWQRQIIDPGGVRIEDLDAADLNGDGRIDIVAVGRQSHNVKIYWNRTK